MADNLNWGASQQGGVVRSPNKPAEPNWAQKYGLTNFLDAAIQKSQEKFKTEQAMALQRQKDEAEMARTQLHEQTYRDVWGNKANDLTTAKVTLIKQYQADLDNLYTNPRYFDKSGRPDEAKIKAATDQIRKLYEPLFKQAGLTWDDVEQQPQPEGGETPVADANRFAGAAKNVSGALGGIAKKPGAGTALMGAGMLAGNPISRAAIMNAARGAIPLGTTVAGAAGTTGFTGLGSVAPYVLPAIGAGMAGWGAGRMIGTTPVSTLGQATANVAMPTMPQAATSPLINMLPKETVDEVIQAYLANAYNQGR